MSKTNDLTAGSVIQSESPKESNKIKELEAKLADVQAKLEAVNRQEHDRIVNEAKAKEPRQAIYAQLHNDIFLPSLGQLPKSMDCSHSSQQAKLRGLKMYATDYGLEVDLRGRCGFIPWGNVAWCVFKTLTKEEAREADKNASSNSVVPGYQGPTKVGTATVTPKAG